VSRIDEIRDYVDSLKDADEPYRAISSIGGYFIPDTASGSTEVKEKGSERHERHEERFECPVLSRAV